MNKHFIQHSVLEGMDGPAANGQKTKDVFLGAERASFRRRVHPGQRRFSHRTRRSPQTKICDHLRGIGDRLLFPIGEISGTNDKVNRSMRRRRPERGPLAGKEAICNKQKQGQP